MNDSTIDNQQETQEKVSEADIGWLAGIIDGEGSISLAFGMVKGNKLNNISPRIDMGNTDKGLFDKYVRILKGLGCGVHVSLKKPQSSKLVRNSIKPLWYARSVGFKRTKKILDIILSHLTGGKKMRAELILEFINTRLIKTGNAKTINYKRRVYDKEDYQNALNVAYTMRTKYTPILERLLRDYTGNNR